MDKTNSYTSKASEKKGPRDPRKKMNNRRKKKKKPNQEDGDR